MTAAVRIEPVATLVEQFQQERTDYCVVIQALQARIEELETLLRTKDEQRVDQRLKAAGDLMRLAEAKKASDEQFQAVNSVVQKQLAQIQALEEQLEKKDREIVHLTEQLNPVSALLSALINLLYCKPFI
jgi:transposase